MKYQPGDKIKCIKQPNNRIGTLTIGKIYEVYSASSEYPHAFHDDRHHSWNLQSYSVFYDCFEVFKPGKRKKFHK